MISGQLKNTSVFLTYKETILFNDEDVKNAIKEESDMTLANVYLRLTKLTLLSFEILNKSTNNKNIEVYQFDKITTLYTTISYETLKLNVYDVQ